MNPVTNSGEQQNTTQTTTTTTETQKETLDWSGIDPANIPMDVIRNHPEYKKVVDEAAQRRIENTQLKNASKKTEQPANLPVAQPPVTIDTDGLNALAKQLSDLQALVAGQQREKALDRVVSENRLKPEHARYIQGNTYEEMTQSAKQVIKDFGIQTFPDLRTGANGQDLSETERKNMTERILSNLGVGEQKRQSIFDPGLQRQMGGGVVTSKG